MERKVYNWANSIQAKALAEKTCVFLGFSGTDYNFRRLIKNCDVQEDMNERHYIFIGIDTLVPLFLGDAIKEKEKEIGGSYSDEERENEVLRAVLQDRTYIFERMQMLHLCYAQTNYWRRYGIVPIWTTFQEMPQMLKSIADLNA